MMARTPIDVWEKQLDLPSSAFANLPEGALFIFNGTEAPADIQAQNVTGAAGILPNEDSYSFHWSLQQPLEVPGGSVKILDTNTFPIAADFSTALVTIKPGAIREVHWHPSSDEWSYFIQGHARMSVYVAPGSARTFDFNPGDVGYVPQACSHYIQNIGTEDVILLEVLKQKQFTDISAGQWCAPPSPPAFTCTLTNIERAQARTDPAPSAEGHHPSVGREHRAPVQGEAAGRSRPGPRGAQRQRQRGIVRAWRTRRWRWKWWQADW